MAETHSHTVPGGRAFWLTEKLWRAAKGLPVTRVALDAIAEFERDCWFQDRHPPTCRAVAEHARRIQDADLAYPIILSADGRLMDGGHRVAKAYLRGDTDIAAVRFVVDPEPERIITTPPAD
ncbi:MAG TPA: hypothetical protein VHZ26_15190 [Caulobacteraceae bacterium]|jgi:hypothetical protein|nr:hypothetical protein [Caulobacteraceae bacterium]